MNSRPLRKEKRLRLFQARGRINASPNQLEWFEDKFGELRQLITHNTAEKSEIVSINTRLAEIIDRVDRLAAALPDQKAFASVERQLSDFSKSLDKTREQGASDADRISRAAQEIFAAAGAMEQTRTGFEATAKDTVQELRQTVITTAPLTIGQLMSAREPKKPDPSRRASGAGIPSVEHYSRARAASAQQPPSTAFTIRFGIFLSGGNRRSASVHLRAQRLPWPRSAPAFKCQLPPTRLNIRDPAHSAARL